MPLEVQVSSAAALVTGEPREKQLYEGQGESRRVRGRATDAEGRPVSGVNAVVIAEPLGLLGDAQLVLPDLQMTGMVPGAVVRIEGQIRVKLSGQQYGVINATVMGERQTPIGNYVEWTAAAVNGKQKPGPDGRPS